MSIKNILLVILALIVLVFSGASFYIDRVKTIEISQIQNETAQQVSTLNTTINSLKDQIAELNTETESARKELAVIKPLCIFSYPLCKEEYIKALINSLLHKNNIVAELADIGTGENYYKYFSKPSHAYSEIYDNPDSDENLDFIKKNCPASIGNTPGQLLSTYHYKSNDLKTISIIFDPTNVEILCAWTKDGISGIKTKIH